MFLTIQTTIILALLIYLLPISTSICLKNWHIKETDNEPRVQNYYIIKLGLKTIMSQRKTFLIIINRFKPITLYYGSIFISLLSTLHTYLISYVSKQTFPTP